MAAHGLRVAFTADTHVHADFVSGGRELAIVGGVARTDLADPARAENWTRVAYARRAPCSPCRPAWQIAVLDPGQDRGELVEAALLVGYDNLAGELDGGIGVWRAAGLPMASIPLLDPATDHIPNGCRVLDVRLHGEWASGHIPGAAHTELGTLARPAAVAGLGGGPLAVMRGHGERAMTAASLLATAGAPGVSVLRGGPAGWAKATGPRPRVSAPVSGTAGTRAGAPAPPVRLGLRENWPQFTLLVVVNAFVGGMVGLERTTTSLVGTRVFHLTGYLAVFSFIVAFGVTKAVTNLVAGVADRPAHPQEPVGRRMGRRAAGPVPARLGPGLGLDRGRERAAGVNQGLAWSMTVNMKIDLVGPRNRGLAMGLNEAAGYMAVGATALATGYLAAAYGLRRSRS